MILSVIMFVTDKGILVYISEGIVYEIVGGTDGQVNLKKIKLK